MKDEQQICTNCGLCCDGTLFERAKIKDDADWNLARSLDMTCKKNDEKSFFELPCHLFNETCTIYSQQRPTTCGKFVCKLIHDYRKEYITFERAIEIVQLVVSQSRQLNQEMKRHETFAQTSIPSLGPLLKIIEARYHDKAEYRKTFGHVIIQHYSLGETLKKYFFQKKKKN